MSNTDPLFSLVRSCDGIGVSGGLASTDLILTSPLANRTVYRAVDGARLEVRR